MTYRCSRRIPTSRGVRVCHRSRDRALRSIRVFGQRRTVNANRRNQRQERFHADAREQDSPDGNGGLRIGDPRLVGGVVNSHEIGKGARCQRRSKASVSASDEPSGSRARADREHERESAGARWRLQPLPPFQTTNEHAPRRRSKGGQVSWTRGRRDDGWQNR